MHHGFEDRPDLIAALVSQILTLLQEIRTVSDLDHFQANAVQDGKFDLSRSGLIDRFLHLSDVLVDHGVHATETVMRKDILQQPLDDDLGDEEIASVWGRHKLESRRRGGSTQKPVFDLLWHLLVLGRAGVVDVCKGILLSHVDHIFKAGLEQLKVTAATRRRRPGQGTALRVGLI